MTWLKRHIAALILTFALAIPVVLMPVSVFAETTDIVDEETPLGAAEDLCTVHWGILILTVALGGYTAVRVISATKQQSNEKASGRETV